MKKKPLTMVIFTFVLLVSAFGVLAQSVPQPLTPIDGGGVIAAVDLSDSEPATYIIQFEAPPLALYSGGINGLAATKPSVNGTTRLTQSAAAQAYVNYVKDVQAQFIVSTRLNLGRPVEALYTYQHAFNGMAVVLTPQEASSVAKIAGVQNVFRETIEYPLTDVGPEWIGAPGIWNGTTTSGLPGTKGEGLVVAILDTGINSLHPSFAAEGGDGYNHTNPLGSGNYLGVCDPTNPDYQAAFQCNDKLIGVYDFIDGDGNDPNSPEDGDGHGSHTASTVAGNAVTATLHAPTTAVTGTISGVAPHANIIAYDVCFNGSGPGGGCPGSALLAAVNQVIADSMILPNGIAAINYSISGGSNPFNDPVELAFLSATSAGIFVSASAGNSGPGAGTVAHLSPWVMTVAASTHNRQLANGLVNMTSSGDSLANISGLGFTNGYGPAKIVYAGDYASTLTSTPNLCGVGDIDDYNSPWPSGTFNGEIVVCDRGTFGRVEKGANVLAAGAGGYVLADNGAGLVGDAHVLPGVHISQADGVVLKAWIAANSDTMATIAGAAVDLSVSNADIMAGFSSRGPSGWNDALKPDVTAPGVDIWAAYASDGDAVPDYSFLSGTSMSSPHNAGAAALMRALYPDWTVAQIKSAMMTTSVFEGLRKEDGITPADPFDVGAGRLNLEHAGMPGLVLDVTVADYLASDPALGGDPKTLNIPSMQDGTCYQTCNWSRTVMNPTDISMTWEAVYIGDGDATISPSSFTIASGASVTFDLVLNVLSLPSEDWAFGHVVWTEANGAAPDVAMPVAAFVSGSTDVGTLAKDASLSEVLPNGSITYTITIQNSATVTRTFSMQDVLPETTDYISGTASAELNYVVYGDGTEVMTWEGEIGPSGMAITLDDITDYVSLASLGVTPFSLPANADDGCWGLSINPIQYMGQSYDSVIWSTNGTLELGIASGVCATATNQNMPNATAPNNLLAPWWGDLNLTSAGDWYTARLGGCFGGICRVFEWEDVPHYDDPATTSTFQIWFLEGTDFVWFTYGGFTGDTTGYNWTIGAENSDATAGDTYYYNGAGTIPSVDDDLLIESFMSDPVELSFAVQTSAGDGEMIINEVSVTTSGESTQAWAATKSVWYQIIMPIVFR